MSGLHDLVMWRERRGGSLSSMVRASQGIQTLDRPCADGLDSSAGIRLQRLAVPREAAFWLVAYVLAITILGTSLPAPLYAIYQRQWHFSSAVVTLIFAVYAVGVLATLRGCPRPGSGPAALRRRHE